MNAPRHEALDNVAHRQLRIVTRRGAAWGDAVMAAPTFTDEFRALQAHYPIVFQRQADGAGFQPLALLGFREGENLFLDGERWDAAYVPLAIERAPFLIGFNGDEPVVHVDLASPRASQVEGEPVFLPHGGISDYLERVSAMLHTLHLGLQANGPFVQALLRHELLEPFALDIESADGSLQRWSGFHTIHEERLRALDGAAVAELHRAGHLLPIYMALASLSRLRELVERAERRRAAHA